MSLPLVRISTEACIVLTQRRREYCGDANRESLARMTPQLDSSELLTNSQCSLSELCGVCTSLAPLLSRSSLLILTINNVNSHKQMSALTFHNTPTPTRGCRGSRGNLPA